MADYTTIGVPMTAAAAIAQGRFSGPITTVGTPLACATAVVLNPDHPSGVTTARDPEDVVTLAAFADGGNTAATLRASDSELGDGNLATFLANLKPGNYTGMLSVDCATIAETSISGTGAISGVIINAYARVIGPVTAATVSAPVFLTLATSAAMTAAPPTGTSVSNTAFARCSSALIETINGTFPWTWSNIYANLVGMSANVNVVYTGGDTVSLQIAELWVDVYGPVGSATEPIIMRQKFGRALRKRTTMHVVI